MTRLDIMQEQVKQQPDPCDEEEPHLLTPIQTSTSASKKVAPKQKAAQPRKPRVPAWRAEAIRKETEFAKAYFSEVCGRASSPASLW